MALITIMLDRRGPKLIEETDWPVLYHLQEPQCELTIRHYRQSSNGDTTCTYVLYGWVLEKEGRRYFGGQHYDRDFCSDVLAYLLFDNGPTVGLTEPQIWEVVASLPPTPLDVPEVYEENTDYRDEEIPEECGPIDYTDEPPIGPEPEPVSVWEHLTGDSQ